MNPLELSQTLEEMKLQLENFQNYSVESNQNLSDFCEIPIFLFKHGFQLTLL